MSSKLDVEAEQALRRQSLLNYHICSLLSEELKTHTPRQLTALAVRKGLPYSQKRSSIEDARKIYIPQPPASSGRSSISIAVGVVLLMVAAVALYAMGAFHKSKLADDRVEAVSTTTEAYKSCEATLKPKLEQCLAVQPEANWGLCREAYLKEFDHCM